jgi:hypothetical protein
MHILLLPVVLPLGMKRFATKIDIKANSRLDDIEFLFVDSQPGSAKFRKAQAAFLAT